MQSKTQKSKPKINVVTAVFNFLIGVAILEWIGNIILAISYNSIKNNPYATSKQIKLSRIKKTMIANTVIVTIFQTLVMMSILIAQFPDYIKIIAVIYLIINYIFHVFMFYSLYIWMIWNAINVLIFAYLMFTVNQTTPAAGQKI